MQQRQSGTTGSLPARRPRQRTGHYAGMRHVRLYGKPERHHQVVLGAHREGPVALVGVALDPNSYSSSSRSRISVCGVLGRWIMPVCRSI